MTPVALAFAFALPLAAAALWLGPVEGSWVRSAAWVLLALGLGLSITLSVRGPRLVARVAAAIAIATLAEMILLGFLYAAG